VVILTVLYVTCGPSSLCAFLSHIYFTLFIEWCIPPWLLYSPQLRR